MDKNRRKACIILRNILFKGIKTKEAVSDILAPNARNIDRAFIMELVYGCVRYKLYMEWILGHFIKDFSRMRENTAVNLMTAVYQLVFMRVPDWAAVHEAVEIEKSMKGVPSLVNGVLRNFLKKKNGLNPPSLSKDPIAHIAVTTSHPAWLIKKWSERFSFNEVLAFARANNEVPPLTLRVNTIRAGVDEVTTVLRERGIPFTRSLRSPVGIILKNIPFHDIADLGGVVFIQDEAAQLIGYLLNPRAGDMILDACAAPGGKSTHIAQITNDRSEIIAVDYDDARMTMLLENIGACKTASITPIHADIMEYDGKEKFDGILLDAPCSALGVIRRNPDVKYRHTLEAVKRFGERQLKMLLHVSRLLKKNGVLVYSVCSTEPEETVAVIKEFLNIKRDFYIIDNTDDLELQGGFKYALDNLMTDEGYFFTYPHKHNMDGFFAVRLFKK